MTDKNKLPLHHREPQLRSSLCSHPSATLSPLLDKSFHFFLPPIFSFHMLLAVAIIPSSHLVLHLLTALISDGLYSVVLWSIFHHLFLFCPAYLHFTFWGLYVSYYVFVFYLRVMFLSPGIILRIFFFYFSLHNLQLIFHSFFQCFIGICYY